LDMNKKEVRSFGGGPFFACGAKWRNQADRLEMRSDVRYNSVKYRGFAANLKEYDPPG